MIYEKLRQALTAMREHSSAEDLHRKAMHSSLDEAQRAPKPSESITVTPARDEAARTPSGGSPLVDEVINALFSYDPRARGFGYEEEEIVSILERHSDTQYLTELLAVSKIATRQELSAPSFNRDRNGVLYMIRMKGVKEQSAEFSSILAHRDLLSDKIGIPDFIQARRSITALWSDHVAPDGTVKNIEAHYKAMFSKTAEPHKLYEKSAVAHTVDQYPEKVDEIITFVQERGRYGFTHEGFLEYLQNTASLREGWL